MPTATASDSSLSRRIAFPSPATRQARADLRRQRAGQRARTELRRMRERLAMLAMNQRELRDLTETAVAAAPNRTEAAAWPSEIQELADKISREKYGYSLGGLSFSEAPVRDKDRQMIVKMLPAGIQVQRNDARYY